MIAASHLPQEHEGGGDVGDSDGMQTGNAGGEGVPPPPPSTGQSSSSAGATIPITAAAKSALFKQILP